MRPQCPQHLLSCTEGINSDVVRNKSKTFLFSVAIAPKSDPLTPSVCRVLKTLESPSKSRDFSRRPCIAPREIEEVKHIAQITQMKVFVFSLT
jgi:hypothetical protein